MIYSCSFLEGADVQLLPASYRAIEADLGLSPSTLAAANLFQGITLAGFSVFWGVLSDNGILAPHQILFGGCTTWGILTLLTAVIKDTSWILIIRLFNGIALATLSPTTQALIANIAPPQERGRYFCWLGFMLGFGAMVTAIMTTAISNMVIWPGIKGWRFSFGIIGVASIILGQFVKRYAVLPADLAQWEEKIEKEKHEPETPGGEPLSLSNELKTMLRFFEAETFKVSTYVKKQHRRNRRNFRAILQLFSCRGADVSCRCGPLPSSSSRAASDASPGLPWHSGQCSCSTVAFPTSQQGASPA